MNTGLIFLGVLLQVLGDYETTGSLVINSSQAYFHFCEFSFSPVGVYPFNNKTRANDVSPYGGTGFTKGTRFAPGVNGEPGGSIEVQGKASSYIELKKANLDTKENITILLYVYPLGSKGPIVNYNIDGHGVQIYETGESGLAARINQRSLRKQKPVQKERILQINKWQFIGVSYNRSTKEAKLWHNGTVVARQRLDNSTLQIATQYDVRVGARKAQDDVYFSGRVACLQFYSSALTEHQVNKARRACEPFEPASKIRIKVKHKNKYIEVNENITVEVSNEKKVAFSEYKYDLGDGSRDVITEEDSIHHKYSKHGVFTVVAMIYSRCTNETIHISINVSIAKPVQLLGNLTLSCDPVPFPAPLSAILTSDRGTNFKCYWKFSDGHKTETDFVDHGLTHNLTYSFNATGNYSLDIHCKNRLSMADISTQVIVQTPVIGLVIERITPKGYRKEFKVIWHAQSGTDIDYTARFSGQQLKTFKTLNNTRGWAWVRRDNHLSPGLHNVTVTATNQVSGILHAVETVRVEKKVIPFFPVFYPSNRDIEVNETFVLFMTNVNNGAHPIYDIDFGDGRGVIKTRSVITNVTFSNYDEFLITINASNNVSFYTTSVSIKVHKPVSLMKDLTLTTKPTIFLQPTIITVKITRVSDVVCFASFSNSPNYSEKFDLRAQSSWDPVISPNIPPDVTFLIMHNFTEVGVYSVTVTCENRLSNKTATIDVTVQVPVTDPQWIPNATFILFGNAINITLEIKSGTNVSFEVLFNSYRFIHKNIGLSTFHLIHQDSYHSVGIHQLNLSVWNLVTLPILVHRHVIVQMPIYGLEVYVIGGSRDVEVNESVSIGTRLKNGSDPEFLFDFKDGSEIMVTQNPPVEHKFNPHSLYAVNITARNKVSQEIALLNIRVVKPVLKLQGIFISSTPTAVNNTAKLAFHLSEGSDFSCEWQFGDGSSLNSSYQHRGFYADSKTADKRPFQNLTFSVQHNFSSAGIFHTSVRCQNRRSSEYASTPIVIQTLVEGLDITKVPIQIVGREFDVSWSLLSGTNSTFKVNFTGANISSIRTSELKGFVRVVLVNPGKYVIGVEAYNLVSRSKSRSMVIVAEVPVSNLTVNVTYKSRDLEMDQNVTFTASVFTGTNPVYLFDFGDGNKFQNSLGKATHKYSYNDIYASWPNVTYKVRVTAANNVSSVTVSSINVTVHKPVLSLQGVKLCAYPSNVSEHARINLTIDQGSDFHCVFDFGDRKKPQEIKLTERAFLGAKKTQVETFRNKSYSISYIYDKSSKYRLFVECKNRLSYGNSTTEIDIQEPITYLKISDIRAVRFDESFVIMWQIANGSNVTFNITFANLTFQIVGDRRNLTMTHYIYNVAGVFKVLVVAQNLVSRAVTQTIAVIQHPVYIDEVIARLPQPDGLRVGFGVRDDHFPAGRNVTFKVFARGTNLSCQWDVDNEKGKFVSKFVIQHRFYRVGLHNLSALVDNTVSHAQANITVVIHYAIESPQLRSDSPQKVKQSIKFHLSAKQLGTASCFSVDFGDGNRSLYGHPGCTARNTTSNFSVIPAVESFKFKHAYNQTGEYLVTLNASNAVSFVRVNTTVEVVHAPCTSPNIRIENLGASSDTALKSIRYDTYTVYTSVRLDCERTNKVKFKWTILSHDQNGNQISHLNDIIRTERELNIPRKGLEYGLYEVHFTAQMVAPDTDKYRSTAIGYLKIIPSPLIAKIEGGNLITRGIGKEIKIDATQSKDPDVDNGQDSGLEYIWLCRSVHTQFPKSVCPNMTLDSPYDTTTQPAANGTVHSRGCYGDGQFRFIHGDKGVLILNSIRMIENETFVLFLIIRKGARIAKQYQAIEVIQGDPPVSKIDCKQNCADKINPSKRLTLFASCIEGCFGQLIFYEWNVYKHNDSTKSWEPVQVIGQSEVKDPKGPVFTVRKNVFEGASKYLIRLHGSRNGVKGKTESVLLTNEVPKGGDCFASPSSGDALVTKFNICCDGWTDSDKPLSYEFYYRNEEGKLILFYYGIHNSTRSELPLGNPAHNYTIEIYVKVLDSFKGEANVRLLLKSAEPQMQEEKLGVVLSNKTSGEKSELSNLVNVGDSQAALRLAGAVNSLLNAQSSKASSNDTKQLNAKKEKRKAVRTSVIKAATSLPVTSLEGLQQSADMIASASKFKDETSSTAMNASTEAFERMSNLLKETSSGDFAGYDAVVSSAESLLSGMGYVLNAAGSSVVVKPKKMNATTAPPTCAPYDYTCTESDLKANGNSTDDDEEEPVELDERSSKSRDTANNIVSMLERVSDSVLQNIFAGEQPTVISTAKLNMSVERSDQDSLGGSDISDGQAGFKMPSTGKLFANNIDGHVDKQMVAMNENPYTWGKKSSDITGKVVSLLFKSEGKKLEVSHLDEDDPIDILIPRDAPVKPAKTFIYNCSVHHGWRVHKLVIDKNGSAVNVEVGLVGSDHHFEVYIRREKTPTITEFDWWGSSPNKTDYKPSSSNLSRKYPNSTESSRIPSYFTETNLSRKYPNSTESSRIVSYFTETNLSRKYPNSTEPSRTSSNLTETLNKTKTQEHIVTSARSDINIEESSVSLFLSQTGLYVGTYYIGVKFTTMPHSSSCNHEDINITYTLMTFKSKCLYWNEERQKWKSDGCQVGNLTNTTQTHCRCTHLTAFGSMMNVAPNPIDFGAAIDGLVDVFETGNVTVLFFILSVFLIYSLVLIWARRADKRDMEQIGATPIVANEPNATYHYELTFFTGQRGGAGTTAQVSCLLVGQREDSGICILKDDKRPTFRQGSVNAFLISVGDSLGTIVSLRVWHDNHGFFPAWFLKRVLVRNLQTDAVTVFICERWFALEEDDGVIMREFIPANEKDLTSFSRVFNSKLYKDFTDAHLWFSVILKPSRSMFTRAQRASCCLCLLCTAMVTSCMFYGQTTTGDDSASLRLGPIKINLRSVMIGIICSLVIIPVNVVIATIFKGLKPKGSKKTKQDNDEQSLHDTISTIDDEFSEVDDTSELDEDALKRKEVHLDGIVCEVNESRSSCDDDLVMNKQSRRVSTGKYWFFRNRKQSYVVQSNIIDSKSSSAEGDDTSDVVSETNRKTKWWCWRKSEKSEKKKKSEGLLPYWCLYIAWPLCIVASFTSALMTLFYSMQWGKEKSDQWFLSMVLAFSQDTLLNQPAKVLFLSVAYAIFIKKSDEESDIEQSNEDPRKGEDEEWLCSTDENGMVDKDDRETELLLYRPPDESKLSALRETRLKEKRLKSKFFLLGEYLFILLILVLVSYGNRDPASFMMRNSLEQEFIHPLNVSYPQGLDRVHNLPLFEKWAEQTLIPNLYEQDWYNGDKVPNRTGFTSGRQSMRLGKIRLRQVRVKNGSCNVPKLIRKTDIIHECNPPYDISNDDTRMYSPGWTGGSQMDGARVNKRSALGLLSPWVYLDNTESNSSGGVYGRIAFYPGGGYVAEFGNDIEETKAFVEYLKSYRWIDRYTRAVFIEGAMYNPNTNLIAVLETAIEVTSANILLPRVNFMIFRLYADLYPSYALYSACEFLFFGIVLYTLYTTIKGIYQQKKDYFRETVGWLNIFFFADGIAIVVVYILRESRLNSAVDAVKNDQQSFLNFSECALYSEELVFLFAFAAFIAILKFINFLSFTRCVQLLSTTIFRSMVELQSFSVMLFTIYMAYTSLVFTIFGPYVHDYRSLSSTLGSLTCIVMGVFDYTDFTSQSDYKVMGYFFFVTFSSIMMFMFTNIVITIINVAHTNVYNEEEPKNNADSFFSIIYERCLIVTGLRGPPEREVPTTEEPSILELQWNLHEQYLMDSQLKRLNGLVNSIHTHDEMEDILLTNYLSRKPQNEYKPTILVTEHGNHGNAADQTTECEKGLEANADVNANQSLLTTNIHPQPKTLSAPEQQNNSTEIINQLIAKKTAELRRLQEEENCNERDISLRVKVIKCLQDLLDNLTGSHESTTMFINHEAESQC